VKKSAGIKVSRNLSAWSAGNEIAVNGNGLLVSLPHILFSNEKYNRIIGL
jgi:hypothetical protein